MPLSETDITVAVARHLGERRWRILSMALPGGGSGLAFNPSGGSTRGAQRGTIVPDIVAQHENGAYLAVEAKPRPNVLDAQKLQLLRTPEYAQSVSLALGGPVHLHLASAFGLVDGRDAAKVDRVRELVETGFEVHPYGDIVVVWDRSGLTG